MTPLALMTPTISINVTTSSSSTLAPTIGRSIRIANTGNSDCFVTVGTSAKMVEMPAAGSSVAGSCIMARSVEVFSVPNEAISTASRTHKAALESCTDPANYDYSGGWSETYLP